MKLNYTAVISYTTPAAALHRWIDEETDREAGREVEIDKQKSAVNLQTREIIAVIIKVKATFEK